LYKETLTTALAKSKLEYIVSRNNDIVPRIIASRAILLNYSDLRLGFHLPTGPAKPPVSGIGIPVRFGQKPVGTGGIQI